MEDYCIWTRTADGTDDGTDEDQLNYWRRMLTRKGKTDEEILHGAWRGAGTMWVFVRLDRLAPTSNIYKYPSTDARAGSLLRRHSRRNRCR